MWILFLGDLTPLTLLEELMECVVVLNLNNGIENSLDAKLDVALNALDDINTNNDQAAIGTLTAFIIQIQAQSGNMIDVDDANVLIAKAQAIIDLLTGT